MSPRTGEGAARRDLSSYVAVCLQPYPRQKGNPVRRVKRHTDAPHDGEQRAVRADPRARQIVSRALEYNHIPADAAQHVCREEPANRSSDYQRARLTGHGLSRSELPLAEPGCDTASQVDRTV